MSETNRRVFLFPGQGAYLPGAMAPFAQHPTVRDVLDQIDAAVPRHPGGRMVDLLLATPGRPLDELLAQDGAGLQLALFGTSVALFGMVADAVNPADVLVGHSLGEIAALTAAGAFSIGDGARIVAARTACLERTAPPDGGMLAVSANLDVASALITAADDPSTVIAVRNSPRQTVLSGPRTGLARIAAAAAALDISTTMLRSPFAFHHPALATAAEAFRAAIATIPTRPLRHRVHSPILGRPYGLDDNLTDLLAQHLVRPVDLLSTIRDLHERGHALFIECGARDALVSSVGRTVPGVQTVGCLDGSRPGPDLIAAVRDRLTGGLPAESVLADHPASSRFASIAAPEPPAPVEPDPGPTSTPDPRAIPAQVPIDATPVTGKAITRAELLGRLRTAYAAALDYPESVFTDNADLEADLGVDSVKQTELLARMSEEFGVTVAVGDIGLTELSTLDHVAGAILQRLTAIPSPPPAVSGPPPAVPSPPPAVPTPPIEATSEPARPGAIDRAELLAELRRTYAGALDYPESVFTETADLEADLGVDSVKQTELLARVTERLAGGSTGRDVPLAELATLGAIVDFIMLNTTMLNTAVERS